MHNTPDPPHPPISSADRLRAELHVAAAVAVITTMWPTAAGIDMALHHWRVGDGPAALDKVVDSAGEVLWSYLTDPDPLPPAHLTPRSSSHDRAVHFGLLHTAAQLHLDAALRQVGDPGMLGFVELEREDWEPWHVTLPTAEHATDDRVRAWRQMVPAQLRPGDRIAFTNYGPAFTLLWTGDAHSGPLTDEPALLHHWVAETAMPVTLLAHHTYQVRYAPRVTSMRCLLCHREELVVFDAAIGSSVLAGVCGPCDHQATPTELRLNPHDRTA